MRIQHNIMAMNAFRNYNTNTSALGRNLEKLSSGYKINRAGDDAAGLAISEKMRAQISGLKQASSNVKDGISLVKTAEGALQEVQDMLNRMTTLATQSANGTYDKEVDRANLQKEVTALANEIDRIAEASNFNGTKLLNGDLAATDAAGGAAATAVGGRAAGDPVAFTNAKWAGSVVTETAATDGVAAVYSFDFTGKVEGDFTGKALDGVNFTWDTSLAETLAAFKADYNGDSSKLYTAEVNSNKIVLTAKAKGAVTTDPTTTVTSVSATKDTPGAGPAPAFIDLSGVATTGDTIQIGAKTYTYDAAADGTDGAKFKDLATLKTAAAVNNVTLDITTPTKVTAVEAAAGGGGGAGGAGGAGGGGGAGGAGGATGGLVLQIGDTAEEHNKLTVNIGDMHTNAMGTFKDGALVKSIKDIDISEQDKAAEAIQVIKDAINYVSSTRGDLGAIQNRLEHTTNNLAIMTENIQDAESTIRDVDIADEMTTYTKNNILLQSAQAMLAQANQMPQGVLQLLQ